MKNLFTPAVFEAAEPDMGSAAFVFLAGEQDPLRSNPPGRERHTSRTRSEEPRIGTTSPYEVKAVQQNVFDQVVEQVDNTLPCRAFDPEVFFAETPADVEFAKAICVDCPVKAACLAGALERREPWGVWGGELFVQGVVVARKRPRGRPRKDAALLDAAVTVGAELKVAVSA